MINQKKTLLLFILISLFFLNSFSQCSPVASYPFNGNANDASGNGNNGVLGGETNTPTLTTDRFGNPNSAYLFGGYFNKNWIKVPNSTSLKFTNQMSVSLWFKQCSFGGMNGYGNYSNNGYFILFSKAGDGVAANPGMWMSTYTGIQNDLHVAFNNKNGYSNSSINFLGDATFDCFDNCEWVHCVIVINNNLWQMYINGQLRKQMIINPADFTNANTQDLYIGRMFGSSVIWYPFNGIIDDINIYNCSLTQKNIDSLYGNYKDPLSTNNTITIDSIRIKNAVCNKDNAGSISLFPNSKNAPYMFSKDFGSTYQSSNIFSNLSPGNYTFRIKSNCTFIDTTVTIKTQELIITNVTATICEGQNYAGHTSSGKYTDIYKSEKGCDSTRILDLTVFPKISISITASICHGENYAGYIASGIYTDVFKSVNGCDSTRVLKLTVNAKRNSIINKIICEGQNYEGYKITGQYTDNYTAINGCDSIRVLNLTVKPAIKTTVTTSICYGENYEGYTKSGNYTDIYNSVDGCDSTRVLNLTVLPKLTSTILVTICQGQKYEGYTTSGTFIDLFKSKDGCDSTRTLKLTVNTKKFTNIDTSFCAGNSYFVGGQFQISTGIYNDTLSTYEGCDSIIITKLTINPLPTPNIGHYKGICIGDTLLLYPGKFISYLWQDGSTDSTYSTNKLGVYSVTVKNNFGCMASDTANLNSLFTLPKNYLPLDTFLCQGSTLSLNVSGYKNYLWSTGSGNSEIIIKTPGVYYLNVTDLNGCRGTESVNIISAKCPDVYIPTAFTPNHDGLNDEFKPVFPTPVFEYNMQIWNRWGNKVFESQRIELGWNGKYKSILQSPDIFIYIITFKDFDGKSLKKSGTLSLIR